MNQCTKQPPITLDSLAEQYSFATRGSIGKSLLGKDIPYLRIGNADCNLLYVAGAIGCEHTGQQVLLLFAQQLCEFIKKDRPAHGICPTYLVENRSIYILPCLNPDGQSLASTGANPNCPLHERQLRLNGMQNDFSSWIGNARGVHLTENFNYEFSSRTRAFWQTKKESVCPLGEFPESEPESAGFASFARILKPNCLVQIQEGPPVLYSYPQNLAQTNALCRMTTLTHHQETNDILGGWFYTELQKPSLLFCIDKRAEIAYANLQDALFGVCFLFSSHQK